jgi:beta-galactosidase
MGRLPSPGIGWYHKKLDIPETDAGKSIFLDVEGPGVIVATDNGDPTSLEPFQSPDRKAFNGLCLAIIFGKAGQSGAIRLTAKADGLELASATIQSTRVNRERD